MRWALALAFFWAVSANAQNVNVPTRPLGDNSNAAASTAFVQQNGNLACLNINAFGGKGDNSTDNTAAWSAAFAALPTNGGCIAFGTGTYRFLSTATCDFTSLATVASVKIVGAVKDATVLLWPSATTGFNCTLRNDKHTLHVRDLTLETGLAGGGSIGLAINNTTSLGNMPGIDVEHVVLAGDDRSGLTHFWTNGISTNVASVININDLTVFGQAGGAGGVGINLAATGGGNFSIVINVTNSQFFSVGTGIAAGANVQGITVNQCNFTNGTTAILTTPTTGQTQLTVTGSQFNVLNNAISTTAPDLMVVGNLFFVPASNSGVLYQAANATITGNVFTGLTAGVGIGVASFSPAQGAAITGNVFNSLATAVQIGSSVTSTIVSDNTYLANTTNVANNSTSLTNGGTDIPWLAFTPAPSCGTATFTTNTARFRSTGKITYIDVDVSFTALGTCTNGVTPVLSFTLPTSSNNVAILTGREIVNNGGMVACTLVAGTTAVLSCVKQAAALVNWTGTDRWVVSGVYENQ